MSGPLDGIRVLDLTTVVLGPWAAQQLGDLGADVVKIEPPEGDTTRKLGPQKNADMAAFYLACNRNKRSVVLDLKQDAARAVLFRLAETADVLMHNYRPQAAARLGMAYETFARINPRLVYVATYGYRAGGPNGEKPAYDDIIQAGSGIAALQAVTTGAPRYAPTIVADKSSSLTLLSAVLAALVNRERTGRGQAVEVPMFESLVAYVMVEHLYGETFRPAIESAGYKRILNPNRHPYATKDGWLAVLPYTDVHWREFCKVAGRPDLLDDARFASLRSRLQNIEAYYAEVERIVAGRTTAEWLSALGQANVPHGPVNTLEDLLHDPQLDASGFWQTIEHPTEGPLRTTGIPPAFSRTPGTIRRHQPRLGEHSAEVLREAGLGDDEIRALLAAGATAAPPDRRP
jgi:crotonobetainyl-CoA:carnitine CoA-transferase CaiB-like acyl-CoA transferase